MTRNYADMTKRLDFAKYENGLLPVIVQDASTNVVLMLGYMNQEALLETIESKLVTFYSRSKQRLWVKGESSKNFLHFVDMKTDCDFDTLLIRATPDGPVCHTGAETCFNEDNASNDFLKSLEKIILSRKKHPISGSYTSTLFKKGLNSIAQKVGEEAVELVIEAKDNHKKLFLNEAADLMFHYLVLLREKNVELDEVLEILKERHQR
jgi:phosphoribosyl-AMP cyclohydrolase / phosphoribosyl-ATP pyrophosphohydrolase